MTDKPEEARDEAPDESDDEARLSRRISATNRSLRQLGGNSVGAGLTFGVTLVVFTLVGVWLDSLFGTRPLFLLLGLGVGGVGGFVHLVETVSPGTLFPSRRADSLKHGNHAPGESPPSNQRPGPDQRSRDDDDTP